MGKGTSLDSSHTLTTDTEGAFLSHYRRDHPDQSWFYLLHLHRLLLHLHLPPTAVVHRIIVTSSVSTELLRLLPHTRLPLRTPTSATGPFPGVV